MPQYNLCVYIYSTTACLSICVYIYSTTTSADASIRVDLITNCVLSVFTGQLNASESLFTYPEGMTAADYAMPDHDPPYLDEVVAAASAAILLVCGDNVECIFDSMETGDTNIGLETMNMISTIDEDEKLTCTLFVYPLVYFH